MIPLPWIVLTGIYLILLSCKVNQNADLLVYNGQIYTADSTDQIVEALAIYQGKILATGSLDALRPYIGKGTQKLDLHGAFVMPGLIEGHGHFLSLGKSLLKLNLIHTHSWQEIVELTKQKAMETAPGQWIEGRGWHQEKWNDNPGLTVDGYPFHDALSAVSPDNPLLLTHASGHALLANAKAMELAKISPETKSPKGGRIVKDANGRLTGVFEENAMSLIKSAFEEYQKGLSKEEREDQMRQNALKASEECQRYGICSFQDCGSSLEELRFLKSMADSGLLKTRLWVMLYNEPDRLKTDMLQLPVGPNEKMNFYSAAIKVYVDGALGSYGAWLLEPYSDNPHSTGQNTQDLDKLSELAALCLQKRLQLCVHGIGDRGNREILNIFEKSLGSRASTDHRWRIEHAQHLSPEDIPRFAELGVIASMQTVHCTSDAPFVEKRLGPERAKSGAYAWRSLLQSGAHLANGTDCPVESANPFECMYAAITRKRLDTGQEFYPEQKLSRMEALRSYTIWNAYAAREEKLKGSLEPGKLADFIVLDRNLIQCTDEELAMAKVQKLFLAGQAQL